jgi:hypothetical protein
MKGVDYMLIVNVSYLQIEIKITVILPFILKALSSWRAW